MTTESHDLPSGRTGRMIVVLDRATAAPADTLRSLGVRSVHASDDPGSAGPHATPPGSALVLDNLGIAILDDAPELLYEAAADPGTAVRTAEPEVYVHAYGAQTWERTVTDGDGYLGEEDPDALPALPWSDTDAATWGLLAVQAFAPTLRRTPWSGRGITVAVLDTGYDVHHPDLEGRVGLTHSFITGETVQDGNGHGTHVAGTIGARRHPVGGQRRYSVAPGCRLLVGKVLGDSGGGTSGGVLEGMNWAIGQGADIISMSLGSDTRVGDSYLQYYEAAGRAALDAGSMIVAAAGNNGWNPVGSPANCPSVLAVAAVDEYLRRASFSSVALNGNGGEVDVAGPGVGIYSSWPVDTGAYKVLRGTSVATPHVSGIAALIAQATGLRGRELWTALLGTVTALGEDAQRVGRGLATAPTRPAVVEAP